MSSECNNLYALSFTVGKEAGLALVAAHDEAIAFQILKSSGSHSYSTPGYSLKQIRNLGMTTSCAFGLLMESFVNALEAYDAILEATNKLKGEQGERGYQGPQGEKGDKGDKGDEGDKGDKGDKGNTGETGKSVYDLAVENGFEGSVSDWLATLVGPQGSTGPQGPQGVQGPKGDSPVLSAEADGTIKSDGQVLTTVLKNAAESFIAAEGSSSSAAGDGTRWGAYKSAEAARNTASQSAEGSSSSAAGDGTRWGAYKTAEAARESGYNTRLTNVESEVYQLEHEVDEINP